MNIKKYINNILLLTLMMGILSSQSLESFTQKITLEKKFNQKKMFCGFINWLNFNQTSQTANKMTLISTKYL